MHLISFKSRFDAHFECQVTVLWKLKLKKHVYAKSISFKKIFLHQLGFEFPTSSLESVALRTVPYVLCSFQWNVALLLRLQPATECKLNDSINVAWTGGDKLEVGSQWVYGVWQLKCRCWQFQSSYRRDRQSERQTQKLSIIYIYIERERERDRDSKHLRALS